MTHHPPAQALLASAARPAPGAVSLFELVGGLSAALDLISPQVVDHHLRVAFLASRLAGHMGLPGRDVADTIFAGLLHDVGAFSLQTRLDTLAFETDSVEHAFVGWMLLRRFAPLTGVAGIVRWHHQRFDEADQADANPRTLLLAGLIHIADCLDILLRHAGPACNDPKALRLRLEHGAGQMFAPLAVQAASELLCTTTLAQDAADPAPRLMAGMRALAGPADLHLDVAALVEFSGLMAQVIDFRSRFTATHSRGVAATGRSLALLAGMAPGEAEMLYVAGNLHDIGKLAVPRRLLEKKEPLTDDEFEAIKSHAAHSDAILTRIPGLAPAGLWAARHHERLDGGGYPHRLGADNLDTGSRVLAVADVFTALTEDRPYRAGMTRPQAAGVLGSMAGRKALDPALVALLLDHYDAADTTRASAQDLARQDFLAFSAARP